MWSSNTCVVRLMPMSMWEAWDEHECKVCRWGIVDVPKNMWVAGPYLTQADAVNALSELVGAEFVL
jgi:hypothetical protein